MAIDRTKEQYPVLLTMLDKLAPHGWHFQIVQFPGNYPKLQIMRLERGVIKMFDMEIDNLSLIGNPTAECIAVGKIADQLILKAEEYNNEMAERQRAERAERAKEWEQYRPFEDMAKVLRANAMPKSDDGWIDLDFGDK